MENRRKEQSNLAEEITELGKLLKLIHNSKNCDFFEIMKIKYLK